MAQKDSVNKNLKMALELYNEEMTAGFPSDRELDQCHTFSHKFIQEMKKLIQFQKKPYYHYVNSAAKRAAVIILAIVLALTTTVFSVKALREIVFNFFVKVYEKYTEFDYTNNEGAPSEILQYYTPTYIPAGYSILKTEDLKMIYNIEYSNENGDIVFFSQKIIKNRVRNINTEGAVAEDVLINGNGGLIFANMGNYMCAWSDSNYSYFVMGEVDKKTILKIARSVNTIN